ncbi:PEP-CTERM sorting domain-containing protein [Aromatoleum diolicum]|uniref:PEP-CTERM sorting domain-containing protein n=1 Tax=Aromatoleum diolicum TaxID=75796 RepID=A0ABX1QED3_9RHOO|nr:PEP-CTERM sorting domain-containing protein [Aromatoleum diolicum]NMG76653.1 PEP-CTERM sorting domain-containing protein [Aromatoleum diolicum]
MHPKQKLIVAALLTLTTAGAVSAGTLEGSTFSLTYNDSALQYYGNLSLSQGGFGVEFFPTTFAASSSSVFSTLDLTLQAKSGYVLNSVSLIENGWWNGAAGSGGAQLIVAAGGSPVMDSFVVSANDGLGFQTWSGFAHAELDGATDATVSLMNSFLAQQGTQLGLQYGALTFDLASVAPANILPAVPEPEGYLMLLTGLGMVGFIVRRRTVAHG